MAQIGSAGLRQRHQGGCSCTQGTHHDAKKLSSIGWPLGQVGAGEACARAPARQVERGTGWPVIGLGTPRGSNVAGRHAAQHGIERAAAQHRHAERRCEQQDAAVHSAIALGARGQRHGAPGRAPTRSRRSASDRPPPTAMTSPPSQIQGASGL